MTISNTGPPDAVQRFDDVYDRFIPTVVMQPYSGYEDVWRSLPDHSVRMRCRHYDLNTRFFVLWCGPGSEAGDPLPCGKLIEQDSIPPHGGTVGRALPAQVEAVADLELVLWLPTSTEHRARFVTGRAVRVRVVDDGTSIQPMLTAVTTTATVPATDDRRPSRKETDRA